TPPFNGVGPDRFVDILIRLSSDGIFKRVAVYFNGGILRRSRHKFPGSKLAINEISSLFPVCSSFAQLESDSISSAANNNKQCPRRSTCSISL
ncbi:hypothetical protein V2J09_008823, partial [Rumex salicifolius]